MENKIINIARKEIGQGEKPLNSNKTKYGKWFGFDGVAWCGMFVSWCYAEANFQLPKIGFTKGFAGCQTAVAYFKKNNMITTKPVEGNIVFFDWNADGRYDHTGLFVKWIDKNTFESIEGNTAVGNDSNGGNVMLRKRINKNVIFVNV
jgi:hypothetical protein